MTLPSLRLSRRGLLRSASVAAGALLFAAPVQALDSPSEAMRARSVVARGDTARLRRVLAKAARGEAVTLGFIGGSITQGAMASQPALSYAAQVAEGWRRRFPRAPLSVVNAGIGGTGSLFGAFRVGTDLLAHDPDLVIVEYAVNDAWTDTEPFEGLLRQILAHRSAPAVLLLFMMWEKGGNDQAMQAAVGAHYDLPMLSFRDAVWPEIEAGRLAWRDLIVDTVHPNDLGHRWAAGFCTDFLDDVQRQPISSAPAPGRLPAPLSSALYAHVRWLPADRLRPAAHDGWRFVRPQAEGQPPLWAVTQDRARLLIDWDGTGAALVLNGPCATLLSHARISIDDGVVRPMRQQPFFDRETVVLASGLPRGRHRLRIEIAGFPSSAPPEGRGLRGLGVFDEAASAG